MAKIYGIAGNVTGKIANQVFAVVKGVNVVRQYNASPANPSTEAQVASRAKLKLLSQLAAAVSPLIAFQREGLVSPRNMFIKRNYDLASYNSTTEVAEIDFKNVDMSGGIVGMPPIAVTERTANTVTVSLQSDTTAFDFVQWGGVIVDSTGRIIQIPPVRVDRQGSAPSAFEYTFANVPSTASGVIYAIAYRFNDEQSRAKYAQLTAADTTGSILVARVLKELNVTQSVTRSVDFAAYQP